MTTFKIEFKIAIVEAMKAMISLKNAQEVVGLVKLPLTIAIKVNRGLILRENQNPIKEEVGRQVKNFLLQQEHLFTSTDDSKRFSMPLTVFGSVKEFLVADILKQLPWLLKDEVAKRKRKAIENSDFFKRRMK